MQKKLLLGITGLALLFGFVLAACDTKLTGGFSTKDNLNSVPGPALREPAVYPGVIALAWDSVTNANGYRIVRRDTETGETKVLKDLMVDTDFIGQDALGYADIVGWENQLVHDRNYEYRVISLNSNGINKTAGEVVVLSGESTVTVTANVPARSAFTFDLTTGDTNVNIVSEAIISNNSDKLLVTLDTVPYLFYSVAYLTRDAVVVRNLSSAQSKDGAHFAGKQAVTFPLFGGVNTVKVTAQFIGDATASVPYYNTTKGAPHETGNLAYTTLNTVSRFNSVRAGKDVRFTWQPVTGAESYQIFKAETDQNALTSTYYTVINDWEDVTTTIPELESGAYSAAERNVDTTKFYIYAIVATGSGTSAAKSPPSFACLDAVALPAPSFNVMLLTGDPEKVQVIWDGAEGVTYTLFFAKAVWDTSGNYVLQEAFKSINVPAAPLLHYVVDVTSSTIVKRTEYAFKLVAEKDGQKSETIKALNTRAFASTVDFNLSHNTWTDTDGYNTIRVDVSSGGNFTPVTGEKFTLKIYRRKADDPQSTFTPVKEELNFVPYTNSTYTYLDTGTAALPLVQDTAYVYRVEVSQGTTVYKNTGIAEVEGVTPATPSSRSFFASSDSGTGGYPIATGVTIPAKSLYFTSGSAINGLVGAPVNVRYNGSSVTSSSVQVKVDSGTFYY
jgi:hypothetical protein